MSSLNDGGNKQNIGRPLGIRGVRVLASRHSHECQKVLIAVASSQLAPDADRIRTAELVLAFATSWPGEGAR